MKKIVSIPDSPDVVGRPSGRVGSRRISAESAVFAGTTDEQVLRMAARNRAVDLRDAGGIRLALGKTVGTSELVPGVLPLECREVHFYHVEGAQWTPDPKFSLPTFPYRVDHGSRGGIVPVLGDFYVGERRLTDGELERMGLHAVRDEHGRKMTFPYFHPVGTRAIWDITYHPMFAFGLAVQRNATQWQYHSAQSIPTLLTSSEKWHAYHARARITPHDMVRLARSRLEREWTQEGGETDTVRLEVFLKRNAIREMYNILFERLMEVGGMQVIPTVCLQFKGGGSRYHGRLVLSANGEPPHLQSGEQVLKVIRTGPNGTHFFVGYPSLVGKEGIFLGQMYQEPPCAPAPIGGALEFETCAIPNDAALFSMGGVPAGFSISAIRLIDYNRAAHVLGPSAVSAGDLYVIARAVCSDTRRLTEISRPVPYQNYIQATYGDDFLGGRQKHLELVARQLGKNINAILERKLKLKDYGAHRPNTGGNLSVKGSLFDSGELEPAREYDECSQLICFWVEDFLGLAEAAGLNMRDLVSGPDIFSALMTNALRAEIALLPAMLEALATLPRNEAVREIAANILFNWKEIRGIS